MRNARASVLAFTLVELLVTISIIAVLAALLLPTLGRGQESGRVAACQSNLHQIGLALQVQRMISESFRRLRVQPITQDFSHRF